MGKDNTTITWLYTFLSLAVHICTTLLYQFLLLIFGTSFGVYYLDRVVTAQINVFIFLDGYKHRCYFVCLYGCFLISVLSSNFYWVVFFIWRLQEWDFFLLQRVRWSFWEGCGTRNPPEGLHEAVSYPPSGSR